MSINIDEMPQPQQELMRRIDQFRRTHTPDEELNWDYVQWWFDLKAGVPPDAP